MNFNLNKTQELFRQMIREFAEKEVKPLAAEIDEQERFPQETVEKMAKLGIFGIPVPTTSCIPLQSRNFPDAAPRRVSSCPPILPSACLRSSSSVRKSRK